MKLATVLLICLALPGMTGAQDSRAILAAIPVEQRIVIPAIGPARATITVFTDTDCPYCLQLHRQIDELRTRGAEIQYLFFPRSGVTGASFDEAVAVWCAADRIAALEAALEGAALPSQNCPNPVRAHYELARRLQLKGTPAVIFPDGTVRYGPLRLRQP